MTVNGAKLLFAALSLCACAQLSGCGSRGAAQPAAPEAGSAIGPSGPPQDHTGGPALLPAPGEIERSTSAVVNIRTGAELLDGYGQHIAVSGSDLLFSPQGVDSSGLAWALFELQPDSAHSHLDPVIHLFWRGAGPQTCWVGLANWNTGRWDWRQYPQQQNGIVQQYHIDGNGRTLVAVLLAEGTATLRRVRYGRNELPSARFTVERTELPVPFTLTLRAEDISDEAPAALELSIDPDGSGFIALDGGTELEFTATQSGRHTARLLLTDDEGAAVVQSLDWSDEEYYVWDGGSAFTGSFFYDIAAHPAGGFYAIGARAPESFWAYSAEILVTRYAADGSHLWSRTLDFPAATPLGFVFDCACGPGGELYIATHDAPNGGRPGFIFLASFDQSGALRWQQRWGGTRAEQHPRPSLLAGGFGQLYLLAAVSDFSVLGVSRAPALSAFDGSSGAQLWSRGVDIGSDGDFVFSPADGLAQDESGDLYFGAASVSSTGTPQGFRPGLARFSAGGELEVARSWEVGIKPSSAVFAATPDGNSALVFRDGWDDKVSQLALLQSDSDFELSWVTRYADWDGFIWYGELNYSTGQLFWLNCMGIASELVNFSALPLAAQVRRSEAYLPALAQGTDGRGLLIAGVNVPGLPDWELREALPGVETLPATEMLELTVVDLPYVIETTSYPVENVEPRQPATGTGGLVVRFDPGAAD